MTVVIEEQSLLDQLLRSPRLPIMVRKIEKILDDERAKRQAFYNQISEGDKAEYINGEVIFHSPVKLRHNVVAKRLLVLLDAHVGFNDLGFVGYEKIMIALSRNDYEPDICYFDRAKSVKFTEDQMLFPAPDFVVEVLSDSTAANDRGIKFEDYAAHGVHEYWIIDPADEFLEQYRLVDEQYELVMKSNNGTVTSLVLPNFIIPVRAIFDDQLHRETLQSIIAE